MKTLAGAAIGLGTLLFCNGIAAQAADDDNEDYLAPPVARRGGFTIGAGVGLNAGALTGFPNDLAKIDEPEFEQDFGGLGVASQIWVGGMLRDWLGFAVGVSNRTLRTSDGEGGRTGAVTAIVLHLDAYPLWGLGGTYRDLGVNAQVGAGFGGVVRSEDSDDSLADGGFLSSVSLGVFHETWRFYKFTVGPQLSYQLAFSESLTSQFLSIGLRTSFYSTLL